MSQNSDNEALTHLIDTFQFLDDWTDRYAHLIEIAKKLEPLSPDEKVDSNKVDGCMSQVWLTTSQDVSEPELIRFKGDSDAQIVRGLVAVVMLIFSGRKAEEIIKTDERKIFEELGLDAHLSVGRRNGLESMVKTIKHLASQSV